MLHKHKIVFVVEKSFLKADLFLLQTLFSKYINTYAFMQGKEYWYI